MLAPACSATRPNSNHCYSHNLMYICSRELDANLVLNQNEEIIEAPFLNCFEVVLKKENKAFRSMVEEQSCFEEQSEYRMLTDRSTFIKLYDKICNLQLYGYIYENRCKNSDLFCKNIDNCLFN